LAQAAGIGALADKAFLHHSLELNARGLRFLTKAFTGAGLKVAPSEANFVMIEMDAPEQAAKFTEEMLLQGIIVRPLRAFGLAQCVRISTGSDDDNQRCADAAERVLAAVKA